jgi:hypothetical protein
MSNEKVTAIAAENEAVRNKRLALRAKKVAIEEARDICVNLAMRKELRMVGSTLQLRQTYIRYMLTVKFLVRRG